MTIFNSLVVSYFLSEVIQDYPIYPYNLPHLQPGSSWTLLQSCTCYPFIPIAVITYQAMYLFMFLIMEEETATHCSILTWKIPCTEEPGGLHFIGLQRVWHNWVQTHLFCSLMYFQLSKLTPEPNWCSILIWSMNKQMLVKKIFKRYFLVMLLISLVGFNHHTMNCIHLPFIYSFIYTAIFLKRC